MKFTCIASIAALAAVPALAVADYDEAVDGDLSDDRFAPTSVPISLGTTSVRMDVVASDAPGGDRDYFTVGVGAGESIDSIVLAENSIVSGFDDVAFIGLAFDDVFDFDPDSQTGPGLEGFVLTGSGLVGTDLLGSLSGGQSALGPGDYTFWVQQTGPDLTTVQLDIALVPAPGAAATLALASLGLTRRRR